MYLNGAPTGMMRIIIKIVFRKNRRVQTVGTSGSYAGAHGSAAIKSAVPHHGKGAALKIVIAMWAFDVQRTTEIR
jgi:hypothetical protein